MGLDMYLYKKNKKAATLREAMEMEDEYTAHWTYDAENGFLTHGYERGFEEIAYWRKANAVHGWFERNCGADNCEYYPVSRKQLLELLITCEYVLSKTELVDGTVRNGERFENGEWVPIMEPGRIVEDASAAKELLPTCSGFFFGSTDYDEWYVRDLEETVSQLKGVLRKYDDDEFYYYPSW